MRTVFALVRQHGDARQMVDRLLDKNIDKEKINVIAQETAVESAWDVHEHTGEVTRIITRAAAAPEGEGSLKRALVEFGAGERPAEAYAEGTRAGGLLVFVRAEGEHAAEVREALNGPAARQPSTFNG